jgi:glutaredoxin
MSFVVLTAPECKWCEKAKDLIKANGYKFVEFDVSAYPTLREFMSANLLTTVPQVYIVGEWIGGYNKLFEFFQRKHDDS